MNNENILEYAIGAVSHLAMHDDCSQQLVAAGAAEALLLFLQEHREDRDVVSRSMTALLRLIKHTSAAGGQAESPLVRQVARAGSADGSRGILLLIEAMQAHIYDEGVCKVAALLLTALARSPSN